MADNAVVGALRVVLGLDSASLEKGLDDSRAKLGTFASDMAKTGAVIAAAITGAYAAVALGVNNTLKSMDEIGKQSQKIGIPVEQLSALRLAADLSDVSMESLGKGVGKLAKAMVESAKDPTAEAAGAFRALGVSVVDTDGKLRPVIDVTKDIATKFEGMKDGAGKTAASMAVFGKAGADLIPLLNAGGSGLQQMMQQAQALGITFDTQTAKAAEKFRDTLTLLGAAKDGIIVRLTAHMLPALQQFADRMFAAASSSEKQQQKLGFLTIAFDALARGVLLVVDNMKLILQIGAVFVGAQIATAAIGMAMAFAKLAYAVYTTGIAMTLFNGIRMLSMKGILVMAGLVALAAGAFEGFSDKIKSIGTAVANMLPEGGAANDFISMLSGMGINISALTADLSKFKPAADGAKDGLKDFNYQAMAGKNALDQFIASQAKSLAAHEAEFAATGMAAGAKERLKIMNQGLAVAQANSIVMTEAQRLKLTEAAAAAELMGLKLGNLALLGGELNPFIPIGVAIDATNKKLQEGGLKAADYATLSGQAAQLTSKLWADSATSLGSSFESIGSSLSQMGDGWARFAKVGQAIGAAIAFVNAYVAASEAFAKTSFPANIAIAAGVLAKGIGMVAAIKGAVAPSGHAMGGAFRVPGGVGGGDRVPFNAMLEPGELVEITSNRSDGYKSGGDRDRAPSGGTTLVYLDAALRPLAEALFPHFNAAMRDGHELKLATI